MKASAIFCTILLLLLSIIIIGGIFIVCSGLQRTDKDQPIIDHKNHPVQKRSIKEDEDVPFPIFPENYHASGLLILPHSGIAEPFEIWFSGSSRNSRIDYYYGTDKTIQRGDKGKFGQAYKIVPMYDDNRGNFVGCWTVSGTNNRPMIEQTIIPNITWFKYVGKEVYTGTLTTKWHYEYWAYGMLNSQFVWVTESRPNRPIRYEMHGYDSMLGSYYDHYVLEYISFEGWLTTMARFDLPKGMDCYNWSFGLESSLMVNPMQEFTSFSPDNLVRRDHTFQDFKTLHKKVYKDQKEHNKRKHIFNHNIRYIKSMNRKAGGFKLAPNHFADLSHDEYEARLSSLSDIDPKNHKGIIELHKHKPVYVGSAPKAIQVPDEMDWRDYGAVSPVKGQGICGSCYTFSAAGAVEGAHFLKTGTLIELSQQQILDCSWSSGNHGCHGGHYAAALSHVFLHGLATANSYGKYLAQEGACHYNESKLGAKISGFAYVPPRNSSALKIAVARWGPAAVSVNVSPLSFKFYHKGIYDDKDCSPNRTRHTALVVGYGKENNRSYWIVKNSWSQLWGEQGYIRIAMDNDVCGITESPAVALVKHIRFNFPVKEKIVSVDSLDPASMGQKVRGHKRKRKRERGHLMNSNNTHHYRSGNYSLKHLDKYLKSDLDLVEKSRYTTDDDLKKGTDNLMTDSKVTRMDSEASGESGGETSSHQVEEIKSEIQETLDGLRKEYRQDFEKPAEKENGHSTKVSDEIKETPKKEESADTVKTQKMDMENFHIPKEKPKIDASNLPELSDGKLSKKKHSANKKAKISSKNKSKVIHDIPEHVRVDVTYSGKPVSVRYSAENEDFKEKPKPFSRTKAKGKPTKKKSEKEILQDVFDGPDNNNLINVLDKKIKSVGLKGKLPYSSDNSIKSPIIFDKNVTYVTPTISVASDSKSLSDDFKRLLDPDAPYGNVRTNVMLQKLEKDRNQTNLSSPRHSSSIVATNSSTKKIYPDKQKNKGHLIFNGNVKRKHSQKEKITQYGPTNFLQNTRGLLRSLALIQQREKERLLTKHPRYFLKDEILPISSEKLQKVLQSTLNDLYSKIDSALLKSKSKVD